MCYLFDPPILQLMTQLEKCIYFLDQVNSVNLELTVAVSLEVYTGTHLINFAKKNEGGINPHFSSKNSGIIHR